VPALIGWDQRSIDARKHYQKDSRKGLTRKVQVVKLIRILGFRSEIKYLGKDSPILPMTAFDLFLKG
jgi:hypothetical protein